MLMNQPLINIFLSMMSSCYFKNSSLAFQYVDSEVLDGTLSKPSVPALNNTEVWRCLIKL
jgi:hypothetical protein